MAILNYTTKIDPFDTISSITKLLSKAGARRIMIDSDEGIPVSLSFCIEIKGQDVFYRLPCRWSGVLSVLQKDKTVPPRLKTKDQALRVSWRIIKDWVESQLAIVDAEVAELAEIFLPYALTSSGDTVWEKIQNNPKLLQ